MMDWLRRNVLEWTTSAALTIAAFRFITPSYIDLIIDVLTIALVFVAAKLAKAK